jgi:hypothetical protein
VEAAGEEGKSFGERKAPPWGGKLLLRLREFNDDTALPAGIWCKEVVDDDEAVGVFRQIEGTENGKLNIITIWEIKAFSLFQPIK